MPLLLTHSDRELFMTNRNFALISQRPMILGECPLWDPHLRLLYWIDITACEVHCFNPTLQVYTVWLLPSEPGCICLRQSGGLVVAMRTHIAILNTHNGKLLKIADAPYDPSKFRFNDGRCDAYGRLWIGSLVDSRSKPDGSLFCLDRGLLKDLRCPVTVSNGIAFSPDSTTFFHSDTAAHTIFRYPFDLSSGSIGTSQIFKVFSSQKNDSYVGRPDGAAVDVDGAYWVAMYEGGCILRLSSSGEILTKITVPMMCPTMVAFGGVDLKTLYITGATQKRNMEELTRFPLSGFVISTDVDVKGVQENSYID